MAPDALQAFFRFGVFVAVSAVLLLLVLPSDSAEYIASACSLVIGVTMIGMVLLVQRWMK
jgi:hypothetical protein